MALPTDLLWKFRRSGIMGDLIQISSATTISLDVTGGQTIYCSWTAAHTTTVNITGTQEPGQILMLTIKNDGTSRTITFGTNFSSKGTIVGIAGKSATIMFVGNGTKFHEYCRTTDLTT